MLGTFFAAQDDLARIFKTHRAATVSSWSDPIIVAAAYTVTRKVAAAHDLAALLGASASLERSPHHHVAARLDWKTEG